MNRRSDDSSDDGTDGRDVSRRRLLSALGATGVTGVGTAVAADGFFGDSHRFDSAFQAGSLDVRLRWDVLEGPGAGRSGTSEGAVRIPIEYGADDRRGVVRLRVEHVPHAGNNPAAVWLRGACPDSLGTLGEVATATLSSVDCDTGERTGILAAGSLRTVFGALADGLALRPTADDDCLHPGEPVCLRLEWDLDGYVGGESATVSLGAVATQCRHGDRSSPPFSPSGGCSPADPCPCCLDIGRLELESGGQAGIGENTIEPGSYAFTEGASDVRLRVTDTVANADGETVAMAFELTGTDGASGPALCRVHVAGGPGSGRGPGVETYRPPTGGPYAPSTSALTDASGGVLFAQRRADSGDSPDAFHAISHLTVAICAADGRCD